MALFRKKTTERRDASLEVMQYALQDRMGSTAAGVAVNPETAMRLSAWWACVELIAGVGSSLPLDEFRKIGTEQVEVPLSALFADPDPDPSVSAVAWRAQVLRSGTGRGNAYADLLGAEMGTPTGAVTVHPDLVEWNYEKRRDGRMSWEVYVGGVHRDRWPLGDFWHFGLFQQAGSPIGMNPIQYHRNTIGASIAAQRFGQQFFDRNGLPTVLLQMPGNPGDAEANRLKEKVIEATSGSREPLVLPDQISYNKISIDPEDSQFLDTQRYGVEEIARIVLGGFVELVGGAVGGGASVTYANREQRMADFIALSLAPRYLVPLESALSALVPRGRYVKHNVDALLRADLQGRFNAYKLNAEIANLMGGAPLTVNDMRRLENRQPIDGGDQFQPAASQGGAPNA
jgi:HK97 family phage portal protein